MVIEDSPKILVRPPQLAPSSPKFRMRGVFNPAAYRMADNNIALFCRVAETPFHGERYFLSPKMIGTNRFSYRMEQILRQHGQVSDEAFTTREGLVRLPTLSHIRRVVIDPSGGKVLSVSQKPDFFGINGEGEFGVEDPRITYLEEEGLYAMTYVSVSEHAGVSTSLATSKDLERWMRVGLVFCQQNKDVVLFPRKINGRYVALHRPEGTMNFNHPSIWISYSKDLTYWGNDKPLLSPRFGSWEELRIGAGTPPIEITEGFLEIYHGVSFVDSADPDKGKHYCAGGILFDKENPQTILARSPKTDPLFAPSLLEEKVGFVDNVVFPTGIVPTENKKDLLIFSGAGDSAVSVRKVGLKAVLNSLTWYK
ncbi:MAG: hypothetical protein Q7R47_04960 [Candidatus Diapherotrites archaeon]|nr:hypothetical protein [Candidatus Diapherotrites archaeon]